MSLMLSESELSANNSPRISLIIAIFGNYSLVFDKFKVLYEELITISFQDDIEIVLVVNGRMWDANFVAITERFKNIKLIYVEEKIISPAVLFNRGAASAQSDHIGFIWLGVSLDNWLSNWSNIRNIISKNNAAFYACSMTSASLRTNNFQTWLRPSSNVPSAGTYPSSLLEMFDYVPMESAILHKQTFISQHGFSTSALLQRGFWWEYTLRYTRQETIHYINHPSPSPTWNWYDYPIDQDLCLSGDLIARRVVRYHQAPSTLSFHDAFDEKCFIIDLPPNEQKKIIAKLIQYQADFSMSAPTLSSNPFKIIIINSIYEPVHSQLCFYNYFALTEGQAILTWRPVLDTAASTLDLLQANLVLFCRGKSDEASSLMQFCKDHHIPTLYMLDDNWFTIADEWPIYKELFKKGSPLLNNAIACIQNADCVLTYNQTLAEDLSIYTNKLKILPTNIDLSLFPVSSQVTNRKPIIGYIGSHRIETSAFEALIQLANERDDFNIFLMITPLPECFNSIPKERLMHLPYLHSYRHYAKLISEIRPDVLLAPFGNTRTEESKCPNKYFEITACGATGIYSKVKVYSEYIRHEHNGLLVKNEISEWKKAMETLLDNQNLRQNLHRNAMQNIEMNYHTPKVLDQFLKTLHHTREQQPERQLRPKVAFIAHSPYLAGAERIHTDLLHFLPKDQIHEFVIYPKKDGPYKTVVKEKLKCLTFDLDYEWILTLPIPYQSLIQQINLFSNFLVEAQIDVVIVNTTVIAHATIAAALNGIPCLLHSHGAINFSDIKQQYRWLQLENLQINIATRCLSPSYYTANQYMLKYQLANNRIQVIHNGTHIPETITLPNTGVIHFVMLCTLEPHKGCIHFIKAAQKVLSVCTKKVKFEIYGEGMPAYKSELDAFINEHHMREHCSIHNKQLDVDSIYNKSTVVVVSSQHESFSLVTIEAMSYQRPVIATRSGGPEEIVKDSISGYLIDINDVEALVDRMLYFIDHPEEIIRFGENGRKIAMESFNIKKAASAFYTTILETGKKTTSECVLAENKRLINNYLMQLKLEEVSAQNNAVQPKSVYNTQYINHQDILIEIEKFTRDRYKLSEEHEMCVSTELNNVVYQEYMLPRNLAAVRYVYIVFNSIATPTRGLIGIEIVLNNKIIAHEIKSVDEIYKNTLPVKFTFTETLNFNAKKAYLRIFAKDVDTSISIVYLKKAKKAVNKRNTYPMLLLT